MATFPIAKADLIEGMAKGMAVLESFDTERQRLNATLAAQRAGITRAAAAELGALNIRVNAICPGHIDTPMNQTPANVDPKWLNRGIPLRRPGLAEEVAQLAVFLLSLLGLPPLAGFAGKFQLFDAVYHAAGRFGWVAYAAVAVGVLNTVVSAGYYLAVLRAAVLDEPSGEPHRPTGAGLLALILLLALAVVGLGLVWDPVTRLTGLAE